MKKILRKTAGAAAAVTVFLTSGGFNSDDFNLYSLKNYHKEYRSESIGACSTSSTKTYEDYRMITDPESRQYKYIHEHMTVDEETGFLYNEDGFIGVALGYQFGEIGSEYYVILDTGIIIPVVKIDAKAAVDASDGCSANLYASVIEFVIDSEKAYEYFGGGNGLASNGNFNNFECLQGNILDFERVLDEKIEDGIIYVRDMETKVKSDEAGDNVRMIVGEYSIK